MAVSYTHLDVYKRQAYKDQILSFQECNGEFNEDLSYEIVKKIYTQEGEKPVSYTHLDVYKRQHLRKETILPEPFGEEEIAG